MKTCLEDDVLVGLKETKHAIEVELVERGVEEVGGHCGHHAAEERHPAQLQTPERRHFFHGEQQAAYRSRKSCRHAGRRPGCRKVASTNTRSFIRVYSFNSKPKQER